MFKARTVDQLVEMSTEERVELRNAAIDRCQTRIDRAQSEGRDLSEREHANMVVDRDELEALEKADGISNRSAELRAEVSRLTETPSAPFQPTLLVSAANLRAHAAALSEGKPFGAIETRARVTAASDLGSAGSWAPGRPNEPRHLIAFSGIPVSELTGRTAQVPQYTAPSGAAGVDENTNHPEYDAIAPVSLTALRHGRWSDASSIANELDDLSAVNQLHGWGIARDLDLVAVTAIQTAAGTPVVLGADLEAQVREAILTVAAATYSDESQLVIVGKPADVALLTGTTPANGTDVGSVSVRFAGARLYPTNSAATEQVTIFAPNAFRVFMSRLQSASLIDPASGANKFGSWLHSTGVANQIIGSAVAVATAA